MLAVNYSTLRNNLKSYCDSATDDAETVFVRVDQNKLWWIKGEETGSVDIW